MTAIFFSESRYNNENNTLVSEVDMILNTTHSLNLGNPTEDVNAVYFVGKNIKVAYITGGMGISFSPVPDAYHDGNTYFYASGITRLAGDITIKVAGAGASISKVYLIKKLFDFADYPDDYDKFIKIDKGRREIGAIAQQDLYLDYQKIAGKLKRRVSYTADEQSRNIEINFELFRENNPNFIFMEDFTQYPNRVYPAMFDTDFTTRYSTLDTREGVSIDFEVRER